MERRHSKCVVIVAAVGLSLTLPAQAQNPRSQILEFLNWNAHILYPREGRAGCEPTHNGLQKAMQRHYLNYVGFIHKWQYGNFVSQGHVPGKEGVRAFANAPAHRIIEKIKANLRTLDPQGGTAALIYDYSINPEHELHFCSFFITLSDPLVAGRARSFHGRPVSIVSREAIEVSADAVKQLINPFRSQLQSQHKCRPPERVNVDARLQYRLRELLSEVLLPREVQVAIRSRPLKRILILPAADIGNVPLAALPVSDDGKQLLDFAAPVVLANLEGLIVSPRYRPRFSPALVVGDPDGSLPAARDEAEYVASLLSDRTVLLGEQATRNRVMEAVGPASFIYLASHGISHPEHPMDGGYIVLSDNEVLSGQMLKGIESNNRLVIMSACQSGLGKVFGGGVFGMTTAWHFAGAMQVIMSLWDVDDCAMASVMKNFARLLIKENMPPEYALRAAMLEGRSSYEAPSLWAPLMMFGFPTLSTDAEANR